MCRPGDGRAGGHPSSKSPLNLVTAEPALSEAEGPKRPRSKSSADHTTRRSPPRRRAHRFFQQLERHPPLKNLRRKILLSRTTYRARHHDPCIRQGPYWSRNIRLTPLAPDNKIAQRRCPAIHAISIGEIKAKLIHRLSDPGASRTPTRTESSPNLSNPNKPHYFHLHFN